MQLICTEFDGRKTQINEVDELDLVLPNGTRFRIQFNAAESVSSVFVAEVSGYRTFTIRPVSTNEIELSSQA